MRNFEIDLNLSDRGWQVMHVPGFDPGSTVKTFKEALERIHAWSKRASAAHPDLDSAGTEGRGLSVEQIVSPARAEGLAQLDDQIRATFPAERLLTPDDVRGRHDTLWDAVRSGGWPTLGEAAGKTFVILHENGPNRVAYLEGHPALEGRAMFVESDLEMPHSAILIRNNPTDPTIDDLARAGYLIRTRVDSQGQWQAANRERALASGAHILTTDYPRGEIEAKCAFSLPEGTPARVNPVTCPAAFRGTELREPVPLP